MAQYSVKRSYKLYCHFYVKSLRIYQYRFVVDLIAKMEDLAKNGRNAMFLIDPCME